MNMELDIQNSNRSKEEVFAEIGKITKALEQAVELCKPRLIMGGIRYGSKWNYEDLMNYIQKKFDLYKETGNLEIIIDCINLLVVESAIKTHPLFHFEAKDRN